MSAAEVVAYDKRNDVLLRVLQWFDKVTEAGPHAKEPAPKPKPELDPLTFWSSLPDGVVRFHNAYRYHIFIFQVCYHILSTVTGHVVSVLF